MVPWADAPEPILAGIHTVITDVDDTLTRGGRLEGATLNALDHLRRAEIRVIPATAASAGWASLMATMWPVDAVIAENGGLCFTHDDGILHRDFYADAAPDLATLAAHLRDAFPELKPADDQPYRETSLAFRRLPDDESNQRVLDSLSEFGASGTVNSLWLLAWPGPWDKLSASRRLLDRAFGLDLHLHADRVLYVGDSQNDQSMFAALPHTVGVSTVTAHALVNWPRWITQGPGGKGFVKMAGRLIAARRWP